MFKATSVEDVRKAVREYEERNRGIIDPRQAGFVQSWDVCMVLLLIFTALVTPYEVVFLPSTSEVNGLFVVNRLVDLAFLADMYVQFHLAFQSGSAHGSKWVLDRTEIRRHYMSWWFWIDLLSIAPLWILNFVLELDGEGGGVLGVSNSSGGLVLRASAEEGKSVSEMLQVVRMVRLLRLIKVARILKASKIFRRLEISTDVSYAFLGMAKLFATLFSWSHLQACLWGLLPQLSGETYNWIVALRRSHADCALYADSCDVPLAPWDVYSAAFYWSVMTLSSVGYGEMLPVTTVERTCCSVLMLFSSMLWCYIMGQACTLAATFDPGAHAFHDVVDTLNRFMQERDLPQPLRRALRTYFHSSRQRLQENEQTMVIGFMSPFMQASVALASNREWLDRIWYLKPTYFDGLSAAREMYSAFVAALSMKLHVHAYVAQERVASGSLCILRRGLVCRRFRFYSNGKVWGEDMILDDPSLIDHTDAVALTYIEVSILSRSELNVCCRQFPPCGALLRRASRRMLMQRLLLRALRKELGLAQRDGCRVRSILEDASASSTASRGLESLQRSLADKVDELRASFVTTTLHVPELDGDVAGDVACDVAGARAPSFKPTPLLDHSAATVLRTAAAPPHSPLLRAGSILSDSAFDWTSLVEPRSPTISLVEPAQTGTTPAPETAPKHPASATAATAASGRALASDAPIAPMVALSPQPTTALSPGLWPWGSTSEREVRAEATIRSIERQRPGSKQARYTPPLAAAAASHAAAAATTEPSSGSRGTSRYTHRAAMERMAQLLATQQELAAQQAAVSAELGHLARLALLGAAAEGEEPAKPGQASDSRSSDGRRGHGAASAMASATPLELARREDELEA